MSNPLSVSVHAANIHDTVFGLVPATGAYGNYPMIKKFCGDGGYRKTFEAEVFEVLGLGVDISERISPGFAVIPKRWVVERTFGWLGHSRRLSKDFEIRTYHSEAMVHISHLHTLLKQL
jgi:putative transposase